MERRAQKAFDLGKCLDFQNKKLLLIGHGCIGSTFLTLILRHTNIPHQNILVVDKKKEALQSVPKSVDIKNVAIKKKNYEKIISSFLGPGDILVDLGYYISTNDLLKFCNRNAIHFINTAVELWYEPGDEGEDLTETDPRKQTLYHRQLELQKTIQSFESKTTGIITHGANPGWVSHFVKEALVDMTSYLAKHGKLTDKRAMKLAKWIEQENFPAIAKDLDVQVIHISERDSQVVYDTKPDNVFRNTWSVIGFIEEGTAPAELGWGTHENPLAPQKTGLFYDVGPQNQIALRSRGINTWVKSWVPSGPFIGMIVRHEEAFSISKYLTLGDYRPTVHYSYLPCNEAVLSLSEVQNQIMAENNEIPNINEEILNTTITNGKDELGVLLFSKELTWWRGSLLDIEEARMLIPNQSATSIQVGISVLAAIYYMILHPNEGVIHPEAMHHLDILWLIEAYLGPIKSIPVKWSPLDSSVVYNKMDKKNPFRFENFVVSYFPLQ
jgi:homospermidine synthase